MRFRLRYALLIILSATSSCYAENLLDVYHLAVNNDQQFQAATAQRMSTAEALPQAMAALFPAISATANSTMNRNDETHNTATPSQNGLTKYNDHGYELTATLPLVNFNDWFTVSQAKATVKQADATYGAAAQDLIMRTAQAYFNVLQAEDNLRFTRAEKTSVEKQLAQAKARFEVGVDAITSVYNSEASYDSLVAQEMHDENALSTAYQNLRVITGRPIESLNKVMEDLPLLQPNPNHIDVWEDAAEKHNFQLLSLRYAADAAREGIKANESNHLPTLSAVGTYEYDQNSPNSTNPGQRLTNVTQSASLQLSVPLFAGGQVLSQTRQAQDQFVVATSNMEALHRQVLAQTVQTYSNILTGISQIEADRAALKAKRNALESNQAAYQAGTMTIIDVLNATQDLYNSEKLYAAHQYNYLLNTLQLKELAGNLTNLDVSAINQWVKGNGSTTPASEITKVASNLRDTSQLKNTPNILGDAVQSTKVKVPAKKT